MTHDEIATNELGDSGVDVVPEGLMVRTVSLWTAEPLLSLWLAITKVPADMFEQHFEQIWVAFRGFAAMPYSDGESDVGARIILHEEGERVTEFQLLRLVRGSDTHLLDREVVLQFYLPWDDDQSIPGVTWASAFPGINEFFTAVESLPAFAACRAGLISYGGMTTEPA